MRQTFPNQEVLSTLFLVITEWIPTTQMHGSTGKTLAVHTRFSNRPALEANIGREKPLPILIRDYLVKEGLI